MTPTVSSFKSASKGTTAGPHRWCRAPPTNCTNCDHPLTAQRKRWRPHRTPEQNRPMEPVTLTTARLLLRTLDPQDTDTVYAAVQDPDIQRWTTIPSPYLPEHARGFTEQLVPEGWANGTMFTFGLFLPEGEELAGMLSLTMRSRARPRSVLGHQGTPRQRLRHRGRRAPPPAGPSPSWSSTASNGGRRSATTPPARWRNAPASPSRAPCAPRSSTRAYAGTAGWAPCSPRTWACRRRRRTLPASQ